MIFSWLIESDWPGPDLTDENIKKTLHLIESIESKAAYLRITLKKLNTFS